MTLPLLTLRRLHQTAHRNILRQHHQTRLDSTKQTASRNAFTASPRSAAQNTNANTTQEQTASWTYYWTEPLTTPFRGYSAMQARRPLLVQLETTLIIYWLGDLSAQTASTATFTEPNSRYEPIRGLRALVIAGICSIPVYKWFMFLGRNFNYGSHLVSLGVKIGVNQMCFTPVFNTYFFGMQSLLSGCSWTETKRRIVDTVPVSFVNSWKVWPAVTAFSFTYLRPANRPVFAGCFAVVWQTYLSWLNKQAERAEGQDGKVEENDKRMEKRIVGGGKKAVEGVKV